MSKVPLSPAIVSSLNRRRAPLHSMRLQAFQPPPIAMDRQTMLLYNSIRLLFKIYPSAAVRLLLYIVLHPKRRDATYADYLPKHTNRLSIPYKNRELIGYEWGSGDKTILLVHGWQSDVGRMLPLAQLLFESGFRVLAFDAPGHGFSPNLCTNMVDYGDALNHIVENYAPIYGIVAHSYGASATVLMLNQHPNITLQRLVLLSSMQNMAQLINLFKQSFDLPDVLWCDLQTELERHIGQSVDSCDVVKAVRQLKVKGMVVHDHDDQLIPVESGRKIANAWCNSRYIETKFLDHHGTVRNASICMQVIEFLD